MQLYRNLASALLVAASLPVFAANTVQTDEYIAVWFEAEEFDNKGIRWVLTDADTEQTEDDPDGNHSDSASGGQYLEVLPDYRVTHEDAFHPDGSLWNAFQGPELTYSSIDFPEAGRYYVHLRAYSTGSEDNGAHIGLAGDFPPQARRMQWCGGKHKWTWSSAQRDSGGNGSCGLEKTVYIDIPNPGSHEINIQAREDGFELDRVVFIKDLSGNTRVCSPNGATQISCVDGSIESADELINLRVRLESDIAEVESGGTVILSAILENLDAFDHATEVVTEVTLDEGMTFVAAPQECSHLAGVVTCELADLEPTAPGENETYEIEVVANAEGTMTAVAVASALETEQFPFNNDSSVSIEGVASIPDVDLQIEMQANATELNLADEAQISITLTNPDADDANGVQLVYTIPDGAQIVGLPSQCSGEGPVDCNFGLIAGGTSQTSIFDIEVDAVGVQVHAASASLNNELDPSNNSDTVVLVVADPASTPVAVVETDEDDSDSAGTDTGDSAGNGTEDSSSETQTGGVGGTTDSETGSEAETESEVDAETESQGVGGISGGTSEAGDEMAEAGNIPEGGTQEANSGIGNSSGGSGAAGMVFMLLLALFTSLIIIATRQKHRSA